MSEIRTLADDVHTLLMDADPFEASMLGVPGYDDRVPDMSREAAQQRLLALRGLLERAGAAVADTPADQVTLSSVRHVVESHVAAIEAATVEHTVSPLLDGPGILLLVASQTRVTDEQSASDYLTRVRGFAGYLDGCGQRLREGLAQGRTPVATLVRTVVAQVEGYLASSPDADSDAVAAPKPPEDWARAAAWTSELLPVIRDSVRPAFGRYRDLLVDELLPAARSDERCGLVHLPGGLADYRRLIRVHTTLPLDEQEVHDTGVAAVTALVAQMTALGRRLGIASFPEVLEGARNASAGVRASEAMAQARLAVARAEALSPQWFPEPLLAPCVVEPMSDHLAAAGLPPMYVPPSPDGARPGTYLFNALKPNAGSGWDLEATAYHEAVPGHHLQVSRTLMKSDLPALQREGMLTAQAEGWGLYAEHLAEEMGLYTDDHQRLGALAMRTTRAARLVVDSGVHAFGWSRSRALDYLRDNVPLPVTFLENEIDRYIGWPGQALAYYTGFSEILRLRERAEQVAGADFDVRGFHGALLDAGSVPLPALGTAVDAWLTR